MCVRLWYSKSSLNRVQTTASTYSLTLPPKAKTPIVAPYHFYSEFKPQDLLLSVWAEVSPVEEGVKVRPLDSSFQ